MKKTKNSKIKRKIHKHLYRSSYPAHVLAIVLAVIMFAEGMMFGVASASDVRQGLEVLDMSEAVVTTQSDLVWLAQPLTDTVSGINMFYRMSTDEAMKLLDNNLIVNMVTLTQDVAKFYQAASYELASALDFSDAILPASAYTY